MAHKWDFSDWRADKPPNLTSWLHDQLGELLDLIVDGCWSCDPMDASKLEWRDKWTESDDPLITLTAAQFRDAVITRLRIDFPEGEDSIWPAHKKELEEQWARIYGEWGAALDKIEAVVTEILARRIREDASRAAR